MTVEATKTSATVEYYGGTCEAVKRVNCLLGLSASGREQDWEIEYADPSRIAEMLGLLRVKDLDLESRSALWLLILASFETSLEEAQFNESLAKTSAQLLSDDREVLSRMRFHWLGLGRSDYPEEMRILLSMH